MVIRRGVEVQLGVGHRAAAVVGAEDVRQVADAHVVGDDRQVGPAEPPSGGLQVADGRGERRARVEALVRLGQPAQQRGGAGRRSSAVRSAASSRRSAARSTCIPSSDVAVEARIWVRPAAADGSPAGQRVPVARALHEHDALDDAGVDAAPARRRGDLRRQRSDARGGGERAAGALGEERLPAARDRPGGELRLAPGLVDERVAAARHRARPGQRRGRWCGSVVGCGEDRDQQHHGRSAQDGDGPARHGPRR